MLNLLKKDLILQKKMLLVYIILFYAMSDMGMVATTTMISSFFVIQSHYYDEKDGANRLLNSLPFTRIEIVSSKYIGAISVAIATLILYFIFHLTTNSGTFSIDWTQVILSFCFIMFFTGFYLPFFYKFTHEYLIAGFTIIFVLLIMSFRKWTGFFGEKFNGILSFITDLSVPLLYTSLLLIACIVFALSWILSIRIYQNKEI
jgi:ABC-2 type transport system permease protein